MFKNSWFIALQPVECKNTYCGELLDILSYFILYTASVSTALCGLLYLPCIPEAKAYKRELDCVQADNRDHSRFLMDKDVLVGGDTSGLEPRFPPANPTGDASFNRSSSLANYTQAFYETHPSVHCFMQVRLLVNGTGLLPFSPQIRQASFE